MSSRSTRSSSFRSSPRTPRCSSSRSGSARSTPRSSWRSGHTRAGSTTNQPSPGSAVSHRSRSPPATATNTDSAAEVTASSTERSTRSRGPGCATTPRPSPTSNDAPNKASARPEFAAASSATSPARPTARCTRSRTRLRPRPPPSGLTTIEASRTSTTVDTSAMQPAVSTRARWRSPGSTSEVEGARASAQDVPGGPSRTVGAYSTSWIRPSKVRLSVMVRATSGYPS